MKKHMVRNKVFLYLVLAILGILFIFPFYWMLRTSLMDLSQIFELPPVLFPSPLCSDNYQETLKVFPLNVYMVNSLFITTLSTLGAVLTSSLCAYGFTRIRWRGRDTVFAIILSSMMMPAAVTIIPVFLGWNAIGLTNTFLPLILPSWFGGGAMYVFLLRQFFMTLPKELDQSAKVDGAGHFRIYWQILLPNVKPALIVVMLFSFLASWNDFLNPIIYLNTQSKYTLSIGLQLFMSAYTTRWDQLMAAATIAVVPCVVLFFIGQKYFVEGITMTGLKG